MNFSLNFSTIGVGSCIHTSISQILDLKNLTSAVDVVEFHSGLSMV